jgi:hypothetical protein
MILVQNVMFLFSAIAAHVEEGTSRPEGWTLACDELLLAVVVEFGKNWKLVADVINTGLKCHGLVVSAPFCRFVFLDIQVRSTEKYGGPFVQAVQGKCVQFTRWLRTSRHGSRPIKHGAPERGDHALLDSAIEVDDS